MTPGAARASRIDAAAPARAAQIDRVVVHAAGEAAFGAHLAARLPAAIEAALRAAGPADERALRALIDEAAREAAR